MAVDKLSKEEFENLLAAQPEPVDPAATAAGTAFMELLSTVDRALLQEVMAELHYEPGDVILREGDMGDAMYLIWSGRVAVVKGGLHSPTIVMYRQPGEVVGEMALLEHKPRSASIVALDSVRLLRINQDRFNELLKTHSEFGANILASLSARLRAAQEMASVKSKIGRELTAELTTLQSENKHLLELQQLRQEMSDLIIHDLRSPLGNIHTALNMLELVLPEEVLAENRELLTIADVSYQRMQNLIDSLLDVTRLEEDDVPLSLMPLSLPALVEQAETLFAFTIERRDIDFVKEFPDDLPDVLGDEERLRRVLANLLDNAVKFTPKNGRITLTAVANDQEVRVTLTDNGPGIPLADRERIFQRFAQAGSGDVRQRGFGLGLVYCRLAVQAHNGRIWVEDGEEGVGSRFVFTLPLIQEEETA
ncbi:MAG: cyclic nucleotide-binding domain-containing protein [Chloroflexi bacterium]|nr:cyclic nucleotide-binding domain-containing protein [Chloroflexota bacterium]